MEIKENKNAVWTVSHINHMRKYQEYYDLSFTDEEFDLELNNIREGKATKRCDRSNMRCFELFVDGNQVGDITINLFGNRSELDLVIFDDYANHKYGTKAIGKFISMYHKELGELIKAVVLKKNLNKSYVKNMLIKNGFELVNITEKGSWVFVRKLK